MLLRRFAGKLRAEQQTKGPMMTRYSRRASLGLMAATLALPSIIATRAQAGREQEFFQDSMGYALNGYDPVAYFEIEEAAKGTLDHALEERWTTWLFTRVEYRELYQADPDRYTPQFNGFCAEAMARGYKRRSDPTLWVKIDGKVYLHYSVVDQNRWAEDIRGNIRLAEKKWEEIRTF